MAKARFPRICTIQSGAPRYASCTAIEEVQVGVLTRAAIAHLIQEHPKVGAKLLVMYYLLAGWLALGLLK